MVKMVSSSWVLDSGACGWYCLLLFLRFLFTSCFSSGWYSFFSLLYFCAYPTSRPFNFLLFLFHPTLVLLLLFLTLSSFVSLLPPFPLPFPTSYTITKHHNTCKLTVDHILYAFISHNGKSELCYNRPTCWIPSFPLAKGQRPLTKNPCCLWQLVTRAWGTFCS